jgi:hypothetical protein
MTEKKYLESEDIKYLKGDITKLEPWDPMGHWQFNLIFQTFFIIITSLL